MLTNVHFVVACRICPDRRQRGTPLYIAAWTNYYFMASWFFGKKIVTPLMT